ncbi:MAG TPA: YscO family type III secretion system apparatus protein [Beijerinckiaceae bacterium]|nr:YscO family type III secretion system apparatus protein [Beijerinckiaceae bacterium]
MIGQLIVLLRVKTLKEEQALREANAKREAAAKAAEAAEEARKRVCESEATLKDREDAIYSDIMGKVVDLGAIDDTKGRVVLLEKEHGKLVDGEERATHVKARVDAELESATQLHRKSVRDRDKYILLTDEATKEIQDTALYKEENEIEELFSTRRRGPS